MAQYNPAPGPQNPRKYDRVGPNYQRYGEQPGYVYYPPQDRYYLDPEYAKDYGQKQGYIPPDPKKPGLGEQILPIAGVGGALALGNSLGSNPTGFIEGITKGAQGLFGLGSGASEAASQAAPIAQAVGTNLTGPAAAAINANSMALPTALDYGFNAPGMLGLGGAGSVPAAPEIVSAQMVDDAGTGLLGLGGTTAGNLLGAAGVGLGAYGAFEGIKNKNPLSAGLGGAGIAAGLSQLGWTIPGIGWAAAIGAPVLASLANKAFDQKSTKEIQGDRWAGVNASPEIMAQYGPGYDWFTGTGGEQSRDERFLTPDAIRYNVDNYNNFSDWDTWSREAQDQLMSQLLNEGLVSERKGGIYYDDQRAQAIAADLRSKGLAPKLPESATTPAPGQETEEEKKKRGINSYGLPIGIEKRRGF